MSRPITPVSQAYGTMPAHEESSLSARPAYSSSKPTSYLSSGAAGPSGLVYSQGAPQEASILSENANVHDETTMHDNADMHGNTNLDDEGLEPGHSADSPETQRPESRMSQSQPYTPSKAGTLKKKSSLKRTGSLGKTVSRRSSYAGSVKSVKLAEKEKTAAPTHETNNSAFFCPVPTSGNPTELLATRFQAWRKVLKDLINYFRELSKGYDVRSKTLMSASQAINQATVPAIFLTNGGLGDASYILRDFHKQATAEAIKASSVQNEIVMQLTGLRSDLQQKIKEIKGLSGDFKNSVDKEQENTKRAVGTLQDAIGNVDKDSAAISGKGDPFIIKLAVDRQLEKQLEEENYLHRAYLNLESSGRELESIVVGEIQKAYNAFAAILRHEADEAYEAAEKLKEGPLAIVKDREWDSFTTNNSQMVDPKVPVREPKQITYPGKDHPAAIEVKSGMLERKSKYLKNYTPGWYILSPTHLHEFKSADRIASQAPVMSLFLPEQRLGSHSEPGSTSHKFMLKGRQSGSMHRGHAWVFRAESYDTMMAWFGDIKELTEKTGEARNDFVRRTHARSMSGNSLRPSIGAASSNDGLEEDEADKVPYSSEQSVRGQSVSADAGAAAVGGGLGVSAISEMEDNRSEAGWRPPQQRLGSARPSAGGRFPSDINIARGLEAPQSPSSGEGTYEPRDEDHDVIAAAGQLPGSGMQFMNSTDRQANLPVYDATTTRTGTEATGAAPDTTAQYKTTHPHAPQAYQAQPTGYQYGDFRHPPAHLSAMDDTSQYGEWMAPIAAGSAGAVGGAALAAVGMKDHHNRAEEKREQEAAASRAASQGPNATSRAASQGVSQTRREALPIENIENSERQMEASSAVPAYGTSSPPMSMPIATNNIDAMAINDTDTRPTFEEPERSLSRTRGLTESTMATTGTAVTGAPTLGASSGYGESLSTVPTSVDGTAMGDSTQQPSMLVSSGIWETPTKRNTDLNAGTADVRAPAPVSDATTDGWGAGMMGTTTWTDSDILRKPTRTGMDTTGTFSGTGADIMQPTSVTDVDMKQPTSTTEASLMGNGMTVDDTEVVKGANGTSFIPDRPKPLSTKSVQTISELHVPGEFPSSAY